MKRAFTMIELVFVIVVIGILASIAIPRFAATRDDAEIAKARATIGAVKSSLATERQKRIIRGDFKSITKLGNSSTVFGYFDNNSSGSLVLETSVNACSSSPKRACWDFDGTNTYTYYMPDTGVGVDFNITKGVFGCKNPSSANCKTLTQ
jgi:general secretion pathway protein G